MEKTFFGNRKTAVPKSSQMALNFYKSWFGGVATIFQSATHKMCMKGVDFHISATTNSRITKYSLNVAETPCFYPYLKENFLYFQHKKKVIAKQLNLLFLKIHSF